jgi:hypothetical protein
VTTQALRVVPQPRNLAGELRAATEARLVAEDGVARARAVLRKARATERALRDELLLENVRVGELVASRALPISPPAEPLPLKDVFNQRDLAERYGLAQTKSVNEWVENGWLPAPDFTKGAWKFWNRSTVEAGERST